MPKRDGTGPKGDGPRSGKGFGKCRTKNSAQTNTEAANAKPICRRAGIRKTDVQTAASNTSGKQFGSGAKCCCRKA